MKNLFIIILSLFIFYSCGPEEKKENTEQTSNVNQDSSLVVNQNRSETNETGISKSSDKNEVIYKFKKGDEYKYKMTSYSSQDQQVETDTLITLLAVGMFCLGVASLSNFNDEVLDEI